MTPWRRPQVSDVYRAVQVGASSDNRCDNQCQPLFCNGDVAAATYCWCRYLSDEVVERTVVFWASASKAVGAKRQKVLGSLVLAEQTVKVGDEQALPVLLKVIVCRALGCWPCWSDCLHAVCMLLLVLKDLIAVCVTDGGIVRKQMPGGRHPTIRGASCCACCLQGLTSTGWSSLPIPAAAEAWRQRASWLQQAEASATGSSSLPDLSSRALMDGLSKWLGPHLGSVRTAGQLQKLPWKDILKGQVC